MKRYHVMVIISLVCLACLPSLALGDPTRDPFYTEGSSIAAPEINTVYENVDPFSGILGLIHTDLHLTGNGGLDVNLIRTYNSMIWGRRDSSFPGLVAQNERSALGIGWTMHMGIVHNPFGTGSSNRFLPDNPVVEMPDGSRHVFYRDKNDGTRFISKEFWVYKSVNSPTGSGSAWELTLSDGTVYTFEWGTGNAGYTLTTGNIAQVTKIRNAANTASINISYYNYYGYFYLKTITIPKTSTESADRTVTLNYDYANNKLTSITVDNRTFSYGYKTINGNNYLSSFTPPVGNAWAYDYEPDNNTYELNSITYPTGGRIAYSYSDVSFATGVSSATVKFRVVTGKTTYKRGGTQDGTWIYAYSAPVSGDHITTITAPGVTETHKFYGWGNTGSNNVWKVGLPKSKEYSGAFSLSETYSWAQGTQISNNQIANANWSGTGGQVFDLVIYVPFLTGKEITRDSKTYTTDYSSFNTYGDPQTISESGDISRSRSLSYWTNASKNIVKNKPSSESVTGGFPGTSSTSWTYDSNSGNPTQIIKNNVTTNYAYNSNGNLSSVTDANSHTTSYQWTYGKISTETNLIYPVYRSINSTGTIASETNGRSYTTNYTYDGLLRVTSASPPTGNSYSYSYPADSSYKKETRGGYWIQYNYDGFGRPSGSSDSKGVTTTIVYTPYGTRDYADSNIGDKIYYDYFGRIKQVVHKDNDDITYSYSNSNVTVTDENNATATLTYKAFGNPDEKYLANVYQDNNTTSYTRNILGNVTAITQGSISRTFSYNSKYFLDSETNLETGTITYTRDNVGNMTGMSDATGSRTYSYDSINRLTEITAGSSSISFGYDNANNRTSMSYPGGSASYTYDTANRLTQKSETTSGRSYTTSYGYDGNDNITSITYPSGRVLTYGYNSNNQATSITGFGASVSSVAYSTTGNTAGLPTSYSLSNGLSSSISYNSRNLITGITAGSALSVGYGYDSRGNTTSLTNNSFTSQSFGYDSLSRMTSFSGAWGSGSYGYDATGNRSSKTVGGTSTTYGYTNNRVSSASGGEPASYSYNGDGTLSGGTWQGGSYTLVYDGFDNLGSYKSGSTTLADFVYDGDGQRVSKTASGKKTIYHHDQAARVISEDDGNGNLIADYIFLNGKLIAKVDKNPDITVTPTAKDFGDTFVNGTSAPQGLLSAMPPQPVTCKSGPSFWPAAIPPNSPRRPTTAAARQSLPGPPAPWR